MWGVGVMLGPIMGPTIGAWLTDNYSWHWVFLINLPIGIATVVGMLIFMTETKRQEHLRFDWFGFIALGRRHRLAAIAARPRRAGRLVRRQRNLDRGDRVGGRLLLFLRAFADHQRTFRALRDVQGPQFRVRLRIHAGDRRGAVRHHGAGYALHAEFARLSDPDCRLPAWFSRRRYLADHDGGAAADENDRTALSDFEWPADHRWYAVRDDRMVARRHADNDRQ